LPNHITTAKNVWNDILTNIPPSTILGKDLRTVRRYHNLIKGELIDAYTMGNEGLIDIGSGRGGDLYKWQRKHLAHVIAVEPNSDIRELEKRTKQMDNSSLLVDIVNVGGEQTATIKKHMKSYPYDIGANFSLTFLAPESKLYKNFLKTLELTKPGKHFFGIVMDGKTLKHLKKNIDNEAFSIKIAKKVFITIMDDDSIVKDQEEFLFDFEVFEKDVIKLGYEKIMDKQLDASGKFGNLANRVEFSLMPENCQLFSSLYRAFAFKRTDEKVGGSKVARRVFVATPAAETGLTIDTLKFIVDSGLMFTVEFNPNSNCTVNLTKPIVQSMALQRRGRVGRKAPGIWYPAYTKESFDLMRKNQFPDIILIDCSKMILSICCNTMRDPDSNGFSISSMMDLITPPSYDSMRNSLENLSILGFIRTMRGWIRPSEIGLIANKFTKPSLFCIRMVLASYMWKVPTLWMITIASGVGASWRTVFRKTRKITSITCQFLDFLIVWQEWTALLKSAFSVDKAEKWAEKNDIDLRGLLIWSNLRDEMIEECVTAGLKLNNIDDILIDSRIPDIIKCIHDGFLPNLCKYDNTQNAYVNIQTKLKISIHDIVDVSTMPEVIFAEISIRSIRGVFVGTGTIYSSI
jgi:hypothetical protein